MNTVTITGHLTRSPELRFTASGTAVLNGAIAHTPRRKNGDQWVDGETVFLDFTLWGRKAEAVTEFALDKGSLVLAVGSLECESWQDKQTGDKRTKLALKASEVCPVAKVAAGDGQQGAGWSKPQSDPWGGGQNAAEAPF